MVIDSSALLAIVLGETDASLYVEAIARYLKSNSDLYLPASVLVEAGIVADQRDCGDRLNDLLEKIQPEVIPVDRTIADLARNAFRKYGRGRHPAKLNFGDCISYAVARHLGFPLLFKGEDFKLTDIRSALANAQN